MEDSSRQDCLFHDLSEGSLDANPSTGTTTGRNWRDSEMDVLDVLTFSRVLVEVTKRVETVKD